MSQANHVPLSPLNFLVRARRAFPAKIAVVDGDGTEVNYETPGRDCDAMAGALRASGIRPGDRVAVLDLNTRWLLAAHYGVPGPGAALVALNSRLAAPEYRDILAHSRARVLLLSPALLPVLDVSSADQLPVEKVVLLPGGTDQAGLADQHAAPDRVYFEALPKTSTGKIQKHVLRATARDRIQGGPPPPEGTG